LLGGTYDEILRLFLLEHAGRFLFPRNHNSISRQQSVRMLERCRKKPSSKHTCWSGPGTNELWEG